MGLDILAGYTAAYNPNLNPVPAVRAYPGLTSGLLAAYQLDNSPSPRTPVAGAATTVGSWGGAPRQTSRGFLFGDRDLLDSGVSPGTVDGLTLYCVARRTGLVPSGAVALAGPVCVGNIGSAAIRLELEAAKVYANTAVAEFQATTLVADTAAWDFYALTLGPSNCKLYRPRITATGALSNTTLTEAAQGQLNQNFRIGTAGTNVGWAEAEVMCAGIFGRRLTDGEVTSQYNAMKTYAAALGVSL